MEDIIDAGTSQALDGAISHEFTINQISVGACESIDQVKHHRPLVSFYRIAIDIQLDDLDLFILQQLIDLSGEGRDALDDVLAQYLVK